METLSDEATRTFEEMIDAERDERYELIGGQFVERKDTGAQADRIGSILFAFLGYFIIQNRLGHFFMIRSMRVFPIKYGVRTFRLFRVLDCPKMMSRKGA